MVHPFPIMKSLGTLSSCLLITCLLYAQQPAFRFMNLKRPMVDAHNCYPYDGRWSDRLDRALATGFPVGIEQDLTWYVDASSGVGRIVVSHEAKATGSEPTLREHFFERVRPLVEKELRQGDPSRWPLIILHFDFKNNEPALLKAVWDLLGEYESWISTAPKTSNPNDLAPVDPKPLLVLTEDSDAQEQVFFQSVARGTRLRLFGSAHSTKLP